MTYIAGEFLLLLSFCYIYINWECFFKKKCKMTHNLSANPFWVFIDVHVRHKSRNYFTPGPQLQFKLHVPTRISFTPPPHCHPCRLSSLTTAFASGFSDKVNWVVLHSAAAATRDEVSSRVLRRLRDKWPTNERLGRLDIFNWLFKRSFHPASRTRVAQLQLDAWCSKTLMGHEGSPVPHFCRDKVSADAWEGISSRQHPAISRVEEREVL